MTAEVILLTLLMFFVLVSCHEFGHMYFAKRAGILVREYAIGFGPRLISFKRGETRYTFRLLPFGGFVRMAGEDPEIVEVQAGHTIAVEQSGGRVSRIYLDKLDTRTQAERGVVERVDLERRLNLVLNVDGELRSYDVAPNAMIVARGTETQIAPLDRQFGNKTVGRRMMTIFAGPMMNFILAFLLFFAFIYMSGIPVDNPQHILLSSVEKGTPADKAGLRKGDIIVEVDGQAVGADRQRLIEQIRQSAEREMVWKVRRGDTELELRVTPVKNEAGQGIVGVALAYPTRLPAPGEALVRAGQAMWNATEQILVGLKMLVTLQFSLEDFGGPIRITEVTGEAYSQGWNMYVFWTGILSLYLGIFNLLPFPALDGSRLVFLALEAVRGKPVDPRRESMVHFIGFAMLMLLMIAVTYNDILRLFKG